MDYIISSHGKKRQDTFTVPNGIILKFYCEDNGSISNYKGYAIFSLIYNYKRYLCQSTEIFREGDVVPNYDIWNGDFPPLAEDENQDVNGVFKVCGNEQLPCIDKLENKGKTLKEVVTNIANNGNNGNKFIHCLFCRG